MVTMFLLLIWCSLLSLQPLHVNGRNSTSVNTASKSCPPWFYYNFTTSKCECFHHPAIVNNVICTESEALLRFGSCMTYDDEDETTSVGPCISFMLHNRNASKSHHNYLQLPRNVSELNDYMCSPMNAKGLVCSQCIDGFGPAVFSYGFPCANCVGAWYGVPIYIFFEFFPITLFYLFILVFPLSVTRAPMTTFVFCSQILSLFFEALTALRASLEYELGGVMFFIFKFVSMFYGVWNLDFLRYMLPPFCISRSLKQLHIVNLFYIAAFYPLFMIGITWACIELYSRNCRPLVWLWNKTKSLVSKYRKRESRSTIVDVFGTFFLLSYTKMMSVSLYTLFAISIVNMNNKPTIKIAGVDSNIEFLSKEHIPFALLAFIILIGPVLLPALLLAFYPVRLIRTVMGKCGLRGRAKIALDIFVQKFYVSYRDGLSGGKDMRPCASLYFFLRILIFVVTVVDSEVLYFFTLMLIFCGVCLFVAIVRPYRKSYVNNLDTLVFTNLSVTCTAYILYIYITPGYSKYMALIFFIFYSLPLVGLFVVIIYQMLKRIPFLRYEPVKLYVTKSCIHICTSCMPKERNCAVVIGSHVCEDRELSMSYYCRQDNDLDA